MWLLVLIAIHVNDVKDTPAWVTLRFDTLQACEQARASLDYDIKFRSFRVDSQCLNESLWSQTMPRIR